MRRRCRRGRAYRASGKIERLRGGGYGQVRDGSLNKSRFQDFKIARGEGIALHSACRVSNIMTCCDGVPRDDV